MPPLSSIVCADAESSLNATLPVFIFLPNFVGLLQSPDTRASLMSAVFSKLGVSSQVAQRLQQQQEHKFLFIFDGLDELGFRFNLFDDCNLQAWAAHSVFVITSRLGFLSEASMAGGGASCRAWRCMLRRTLTAASCQPRTPTRRTSHA